MAAETYPAELRGTLHGLSAFMGKAGALLATIIFGQINTPTIFLICGIVGMIGAVVTIFFSVDLTHVSLSEHDAQLELSIEGRGHEYKGKLNHPKHLSLIERLTGFHGEYGPDWARKFVASNSSSMKEVSSNSTEKTIYEGSACCSIH
jgi:MFS family permease